jgi:hypothetical protein
MLLTAVGRKATAERGTHYHPHLNTGADMDPQKIDGPDIGEPAVQPPIEGQVQAWEEIVTGRFMPRRIRGSYVGRELG